MRSAGVHTGWSGGVCAAVNNGDETSPGQPAKTPALLCRYFFNIARIARNSFFTEDKSARSGSAGAAATTGAEPSTASVSSFFFAPAIVKPSR
ncbi:MAG: hypothetical protein ACTHQM_19780 [Thermoanaerobaculia bacterium]